VNLVSQADLVVSAGGTIAREAALLGVPSIVVTKIGKTFVNKYLAKRGFPLFFISPQMVLDYAKRYIGKRKDVKKEILDLQNPLDVIDKILYEIFNEKNIKLATNQSKNKNR
jgi:predicted glycosyltransferase